MNVISKFFAKLRAWLERFQSKVEKKAGEVKDKVGEVKDRFEDKIEDNDKTGE